MRTATYFHCALKPMGRSDGKSAVNCAAYRTAARLEDVRYGLIRDFTRKSGVVSSFTLAPDAAPDWARDAGQLWNAVEQKENRKNSQLAFEWEVALPYELSPATREAIARAFAGWLVEEYGVAVTVGIHDGGTRGNGKNEHMHVMMTTRPLDEDGWSRTKLRDFNVRPGKPNAEVDRVREQVAAIINAALEESGSDERLDHRSYAERGIDQEPTTHLGPGASAYERRGIQTERGDTNREIIEERLRWQLEQAQPDIDAAIARDLSARFGDPEAQSPPTAEAQHARSMAEAQAGGPVPADVAEHAAGKGDPAPADIPASAARVLCEPRGWLARMKRIAASAWELLQDESSGAPDVEYPEMGDEPEDAHQHGFWVRSLLAARASLKAWHSPAAKVVTVAAGIGLAAEAVEEQAAHPEDGKSFVSRLRAKGRELLRNERGSVPGFDPSEESEPSGHGDGDGDGGPSPFELMLAAMQAEAPGDSAEPDAPPPHAETQDPDRDDNDTPDRD